MNAVGQNDNAVFVDLAWAGTRIRVVWLEQNFRCTELLLVVAFRWRAITIHIVNVYGRLLLAIQFLRAFLPEHLLLLVWFVDELFHGVHHSVVLVGLRSDYRVEARRPFFLKEVLEVLLLNCGFAIAKICLFIVSSPIQTVLNELLRFYPVFLRLLLNAHHLIDLSLLFLGKLSVVAVFALFARRIIRVLVKMLIILEILVICSPLHHYK